MRGILLAVAVVLVLIGLIWGFQRRLIYLPMSAEVPPAEQALAGAQEVELTTEDGLTLGAWLLRPAEEADLDVAVLVANGNAGHRGMRAPLAEALADEGLTVLTDGFVALTELGRQTSSL